MDNKVDPTIAVSLPASLAARVEELKQDRAEDREKSIHDLVREWCEEYVAVRELARQERARIDLINRTYDEQAADWDPASEWPAEQPIGPERTS
jgi:metal-responsive CopG/Arc/MetJ family transcriptional regulator